MRYATLLRLTTIGLLATAGLILPLAATALAEPAAAPVAEPTEPNAKADDADSPGKRWVQVTRDDKGRPTSLRTAIVKYVSDADADAAVTVVLIGAIHVGDAEYYQQLNKEFAQYDALLYELVAAEGNRVPAVGTTRSRHPIGALQNGMKDMLDLEHQLAKIDYTKKNFVHADMSPEEFADAMKDRGESFTQMFFRMMGRAMAMQSKRQAEGRSSEFDLLAALLSDDRARQLKIVMSEQFEEMESLLVGMGGANGTTIINGRNKVALDVLREQIAAGKTKLAIFYGAGHMQDMDERLRSDLKFKPVDVRWLTAWDLTPQ